MTQIILLGKMIVYIRIKIHDEKKSTSTFIAFNIILK
jgi:hypothetical protein